MLQKCFSYSVCVRWFPHARFYTVKWRNAGVRLKTVSLSSLTLTFRKERLWSWHNCTIKEWHKAEKKARKKIQDKRRAKERESKKEMWKNGVCEHFGLLSLSRWRTSLVPVETGKKGFNMFSLEQCNAVSHNNSCWAQSPRIDVSNILVFYLNYVPKTVTRIKKIPRMH